MLNTTAVLSDPVFFLQLLSTLSMFGAIWIVQLVHYPAFQWIDEEHFETFHRFHSQSITFFVAPMMIVELLTAAYLAFAHPEMFWKINLLLAALTWVSTFLLSVPIHNRLSKKSDSALFDKLVMTNWPRTFLWTLRAILLSYFVFKS